MKEKEVIKEQLTKAKGIIKLLSEFDTMSDLSDLAKLETKAKQFFNVVSYICDKPIVRRLYFYN